jgi:hypothetical protein
MRRSNIACIVCRKIVSVRDQELVQYETGKNTMQAFEEALNSRHFVAPILIAIAASGLH